MPNPQHDPQRGDNAEDPRLPALLAWRQGLIESGAVAKATFKEAYLRMVLHSGRTDVEQIRAMLPGAVAEHAEELARLLADPGAVPPPPKSPGRHRAAPEEVAEARPSDVPPPAAPPGPADGEQTMMVSVGTRPPVRPQQDPGLDPTAFAPFTFGNQLGEVQRITVRTLRADGAGSSSKPGRELSWPPFLPPAAVGEHVVLYRLISNDDNAPYSPDRARLVTAGVQPVGTPTASDEQPDTAAVRYYQVWVNIGATRTEALAAQPIKHAEGVAVAPVRDCIIREDGGKVTGRWAVPPGAHSVVIARIPITEAGRETPQHRILIDRDNRDGFVDVEAVGGQRYLYRVRAAVSVDGVLRLSEFVETEVEIAATLTPVTDLTGAPQPGSDDAFELTWTPPPAGEVVIYRTERGPASGAETTELPEGALDQIGLSAESRLHQPIARRRAPSGQPQSVLSGVSWPENWSRAYFTPVTLVGDRALLGSTFSAVRTGTIQDVDLAEYCNKQVLTFDWPSGAAAVVVYTAPKGYDPRNGLTGTSFEISAEEYERYGGLQLPNGKLPIAGCSLHLAPVAFSAGRRVVGAVCSIEYAGLLRLQYMVQLSRDDQGLPSHGRIFLRAEVNQPGSPAFVLVNNPDRIPLSANDGEALDAAPLDAEGKLSARPSKELRWSALSTTGAVEPWAVDLRGRRGWIRLFVNTPSAARLRTIALLDPPVHNLRLTMGAP